MKNGEAVQFDYGLVKTLDVYWFDTSRPEPYHSFGPIVDFDRRFEAVYIFRRSEHNNAKQFPNIFTHSDGIPGQS